MGILDSLGPEMRDALVASLGLAFTSDNAREKMLPQYLAGLEQKKVRRAEQEAKEIQKKKD